MIIRLSETQQKIVQHGDGPLLVVAGPGSGKTRVLTERIRRLLNESKGHFRFFSFDLHEQGRKRDERAVSGIPKYRATCLHRHVA